VVAEGERLQNKLGLAQRLMAALGSEQVRFLIKNTPVSAVGRFYLPDSLPLSLSPSLPLSLSPPLSLPPSLPPFLSLSLTLSRSHTPALSHSHTLTLTLSHSHTPTLPQYHTLTLSRSHSPYSLQERWAINVKQNQADSALLPYHKSPDSGEHQYESRT